VGLYELSYRKGIGILLNGMAWLTLFALKFGNQSRETSGNLIAEQYDEMLRRGFREKYCKQVCDQVQQIYKDEME
jgi:hypothetical protein